MTEGSENIGLQLEILESLENLLKVVNDKGEDWSAYEALENRGLVRIVRALAGNCQVSITEDGRKLLEGLKPAAG